MKAVDMLIVVTARAVWWYGNNKMQNLFLMGTCDRVYRDYNQRQVREHVQ